MSSVGEILKNTREAKGITIEQVAEATSIRVLYLEAIESEQFNQVPGEVYLKGFIRNYANYIGLNGPAMVEKYKEQVESSKKHEQAIQTDTNEIQHKQPEKINRKTVKDNISADFDIKAILHRFVTKNELVKTKQTAVDSAKSDSANKIQSVSVVKDQSGIYNVKGAASIEAQVEFSGDCWTEVYADGKELFVGMMSAGKTANWKADKELRIKLGNIRVAKIDCNGQLINYAPDENGIALRTFKI